MGQKAASDVNDAALTPAAAATAFGVSRATIYRWARSGQLPTVTSPDGRRRFAAADIQRLIDSFTAADDGE